MTHMGFIRGPKSSWVQPLEKIRAQGKRAREKGMSLEENPYATEPNRQCWREGWEESDGTASA
jgi:ribosome modulation factor